MSTCYRHSTFLYVFGNGTVKVVGHLCITNLVVSLESEVKHPLSVCVLCVFLSESFSSLCSLFIRMIINYVPKPSLINTTFTLSRPQSPQWYSRISYSGEQSRSIFQAGRKKKKMAEMVVISGNRTIVCHDPGHIVSNGFWRNHNPLNYSTPLLLMQFAIISLTSQLIDLCLRPLGQSSIVSQIFGGIVYGPSMFGHKTIMRSTLFPARGSLTFETSATFGLMYFLFEIGVKMDPRMMVQPGRKAIVIGVAVMFVTLALTVPVSLLFARYVSMDPSLAKYLPLIAASQCLTPFPNIACLLTELKILNTDLGRLALSSAMLCDLMGISLTAVGLAVLQTSGQHPVRPVLAILSPVLFVVVTVFVIRPGILKILSRIPQGKSVGEAHILSIFIIVLVAGLVSETIGQHYVFGPLVLGLVVPDGPPLGSTLITKLDYPITKFLYPAFLTSSGLKTNIFVIHLKSLGIVGSIVIFASLVKIGVVMVTGRYMQLAIRQAVVVGLMLNARGICELALYNLMRDAKVLSDQEFALSVIFVIVVTAIITPMIRVLYDPSEQYAPVKRRTIQHAKRDTELRVQVCIHNQESVPSIVNLLEASNPTEESPIAVIAVLLVELVGRTTPILLAHQPGRVLRPTNSRSGRIVNALQQYELYNETCVTVQSFSSISHYETMHDDVCRVALDQNANIIILPFHKQWEIDGSIGSVKRAIRNMNLKVIEKAPCSVGIFIDKGILTGSLSIINSQAIYNVSVIYIGGPDDAEALAYAARMLRHENVTLTVVRFLLFGCDNARERKFDNLLIDEVRHANMGNNHFTYQEEVVRDGVGLAASMRELKDSYELILVGRYHQDSPLLKGLHAWSECTELGVIGDMLASPDFGSTASVLVLQQQKVGGKLMNRLTKPVVLNNQDPPPFNGGGVATTRDHTALEISTERSNRIS